MPFQLVVVDVGILSEPKDQDRLQVLQPMRLELIATMIIPWFIPTS